MRLAIQGSRTLGDDRVELAIRECAARCKATALITAAEPGGVCAVARAAAPNMHLPLTLHFKDWRRARGMYHWRSKAVLLDCDAVLFVWDGKSPGTKGEIELAKKMGVPYEIVLMDVVHKTEVTWDFNESEDLNFDDGVDPFAEKVRG